jgi:hypothetical protein
MGINREWATPLAAGAFLLSAVTGVLVFFHADSGLNKVAHEWLSWVLLGAVVLHLIPNFASLRRHLSNRRGQLLIGVFAVILSASFIGTGNKSEPPFVAPMRALSAAPLATLAQVARLQPEELRSRLVDAGLQPTSDAQSLVDLAGPDVRKQVRVMARVFTPAK